MMKEGLFPWRGLALGALAVAAALTLFGVLGRWHDTLPLPPGVDLLLEALPRWNCDWLLSWGWLALHPAVLLAFLAREPRRVPWQLFMVAFWVALRSIFVALNPVGPPGGVAPIYEGSALLEPLRGRLIFDSELFFSGHTGLPFLYALLAAPGSRLRLFCLIASAAMGAGVLLTRNHFVIDVLGAYFMTYSIWALGRRLLARWEPLPAETKSRESLGRLPDGWRPKKSSAPIGGAFIDKKGETMKPGLKLLVCIVLASAAGMPARAESGASLKRLQELAGEPKIFATPEIGTGVAVPFEAVAAPAPVCAPVKIPSGYKACVENAQAHGVCLGAKAGYGDCVMSGVDHGACLGAEGGYAACLLAGRKPGECLGARGGYGACVASGKKHGVCLGADWGYGDCIAGKQKRHGFCLGARAGYQDCVDHVGEPNLCSGAGPGYKACVGMGLTYRACLSAEAGYKDCRDKGGKHGACLGARAGYKSCVQTKHDQGACLSAN